MAIFISYRRGLTDGITGRIHDRLGAQFGPAAVLRDVDDIPDGVNFREHLAEQIKRCDLLLAIIGSDWRRKIRSSADDFVRIELELARTSGLHILPVRVAGGRVPERKHLPASLRWLPDINSPFVDSGRDFELHIRRLIRSIEGLLSEARPVADEMIVEEVAPLEGEPAARPARAPKVRATRRSPWLTAAGVVLTFALVVGMVLRASHHASGEIHMSVAPADAEVVIDHAKVDLKPPMVIKKEPGAHLVSVSRAGYVTAEQTIEVRAGQSMDWSITLEPSPDTGLQVMSEPPGALVWMDGAPVDGVGGQARTDLRMYRIPPGHHTLRIKGESGYEPWEGDVEVKPGEILPVHVTLAPVQPKGVAPPQASISAVINNNKGSIKTCYQRALLRDATLTHGKIVVSLVLESTGRVKHVAIDGPSSFRALEPCLRETLSRWAFPAADGEYETAFTYLFQGNE